jgi:hypothetical protein
MDDVNASETSPFLPEPLVMEVNKINRPLVCPSPLLESLATRGSEATCTQPDESAAEVLLAVK